MAKFGKRDYEFQRERDIDSSTSTVEKELSEEASKATPQRVADVSSAERLLAIDKNIKVQEVAQAISEQNNNSYIVIPQAGSLNYFNPSNNIDSVKRALQHKYNTESESGTIIRFGLFKTIIDNAVKKQKEPVSKLFGGLDTPEFIDSLNQVDTGALGALLSSPNIKVEDIVNYNPNKPKDNTLKSLAFLAVATLSVKLLDQLEQVRAANTFAEDRRKNEEQRQRDIEIENDLHKATLNTIKSTPQTTVSIPGAAQTGSDTTAAQTAQNAAAKQAALAIENARHAAALAKLGVTWKSRLALILLRVAKAYALIALIHNQTKAQITERWDQEVLPQVDPEISKEFKDKMVELYDAPDEDMKRLLDTPVDDPDRVIMQYALSYIAEFNGKNSHSNFTSWIIFASSAVKDIQLSNINDDLEETSDFQSQYNSTQTYIKTTTVVQDRVSISRPLSTRSQQEFRGEKRAGSFKIPAFETSKYVPDKIQNFFSKLPEGSPNKTLDFSIVDYIDLGSEVSQASSDSSDYFMHLLKNNKYTPELVCCLINYILKAFTKGGDPDIAAALAFLKSMRAMLQPISFNYGKLIEDIFNRLFGDLKSRLLSYAIAQLTKFIEKQKDKLLDWMDGIIDDELFTRFCTPLIDIVAALIQVLNQLREVIEEFLRELADYLLTFELKLNDSFITLGHANRNRLLSELLDSLIFALQTGKLCQYNASQNRDIHPDAADIITTNSALPDPTLNLAVQSFNAEVQDVTSSVGSNDIGVGEFKDPKDPNLIGPVSIYREDDGLSVIETLVKFSGNCNSFDDNKQQNQTLKSLGL